MGKTPPSATTRYGKRKLTKAAYDAQLEKSSRRSGSTTYGGRKVGAKRPDKQAVPAGERGLPAPANPDQGETRARAEDTTIGPRRGGEGLVPAGNKPIPTANPFVGASVAQMQSMLDDAPGLLDQALEAETESSAPRKGALELLTRAEKARDGGPREVVLNVLRQLTG